MHVEQYLLLVGNYCGADNGFQILISAKEPALTFRERKIRKPDPKGYHTPYIKLVEPEVVAKEVGPEVTPPIIQKRI
jgi:hypothetical protein